MNIFREDLVVHNDLDDRQLNIISPNLDPNSYPIIESEDIDYLVGNNYILHVPGDGNCLLHCFMIACSPIYQNSQDTGYRKWLIYNLREQLANAVEMFAPQEFFLSHSGKTINQKINDYRLDMDDELELEDAIFLCALINIRLVIINQRTKKIYFNNSKPDSVSIVLDFNDKYTVCHYNLLIVQRNKGFSTLYNNTELDLLLRHFN